MHQQRLPLVTPLSPLTRSAAPSSGPESSSHESAGAGPIRVAATADLPTEFGAFRVVGFTDQLDGREHVALVRGQLDGATEVPCRVHSECLTGDGFGSLRCDCRAQLEAALYALGKLERGVLLYLRQEGRGIGLVNKIRAYALQQAGMDTVDANLALGFGADERNYEIAARMLSALGVQSIRLMTNNPDKIDQLQRHGVPVVGRISHVMPSNPHNAAYLKTKAIRSGHLMDTDLPRTA